MEVEGWGLFSDKDVLLIRLAFGRRDSVTECSFLVQSPVKRVRNAKILETLLFQNGSSTTRGHIPVIKRVEYPLPQCEVSPQHGVPALSMRQLAKTHIPLIDLS